MTRKPYRDQLDYRAHRRDWGQLARECLIAADAPARADEELGDRAAAAKNGSWVWPCRYPLGTLAHTLAVAAHAFARVGRGDLRAALAPALRIHASMLLELLAAIEVEEARAADEAAPPPAPAPRLRPRADIDG